MVGTILTMQDNLKNFISFVMTTAGMQRVIRNSYDNSTLQFKLLWFTQLRHSEADLSDEQLFEYYVDVLLEARKGGFKFTAEEAFEWNELVRVWDLPGQWRI